MNKILTAVLASLALAILFTAGLLLQAMDNKALVQVQTGKKALWCHMADGYRQIEASKVVGFDSSRWYFVKGGSAKSCSIK